MVNHTTNLDRKTAPQLQRIEDFILPTPTKSKLSNGLLFHLINSGKQDILNLQLVFKAGKLFESQKGVASYVASMLSEGTESKNSAQISSAFDKYGASYQISTTGKFLTLDVYFLSKYMPEILPLVVELISKPTFPKKELDRIKNIAKQNLHINKQKNKYVGGTLFQEKIFGKNHPYGYVISDEIIDEISVEKLQSFYSEKIQNQPFEVFLAGKTNSKHLEMAKKVLGSLPIIPKELTEVTIPITTDNTPVYLEKKEAIQTAIMIGKPMFEYGHPDQLVFSVLDEILGGYFGSRLMQNIREEKGLSYGIGSAISYFKNGSFFFISSEVKKENREEVLREIYKEINLLKTDLVSKQELETVKNYMAGNHIKGVNTPISLLSYYKSSYFRDLPTTYFDNYVSKIHNVSSEEILAMANKYFTDDFIEVCVG